MTFADSPAWSAWPVRTTRLTPEVVRRLDFARTPLGRRGYSEADVERFRARVADEIARMDAEKAELRAEIDRLRNYFREQSIDPTRRSRLNGSGSAVNGGADGASLVPEQAAPPDSGSLGPGAQPVPSVQAVNMMSQAQQAADQHMAQAEDYARQLLGNARQQYEKILLEAHRQAEDAARQAAEAYEAVASMEERAGESQALESKVTYLRTYAEVSKVQMRSILDALGEELERLTEVATPPPPPGAPVNGPPPEADPRSRPGAADGSTLPSRVPGANMPRRRTAPLS